MPKIPVFGEKHFTKALRKLGFSIYTDKGKGGHKLAKHPERIPDPSRQRANITIPHTKNNMYEDPGFRKSLINEVCAFGFTQDEVLKTIKKK